jgi:hypothetical protein
MREGKDAAPASTTSLPPVSIGTPKVTAEMRAKELWETIAPLNREFSSEGRFIKEFTDLADKYPRLAATTERTFTTGDDSSRILAMRVTENFLSLLRQSNFIHEDFEDIFNRQLLERWNAHNVGEETGLAETLRMSSPSRLISIPEDVLYRFDDVAWRGYAAWRLAFEVPGARGNSGNLMEFIYWAGKRDDLRAVIDLARDRGSMDPKVLEPLMDAAVDSSTALRDGLL